jgi:hypothetical protein
VRDDSLSASCFIISGSSLYRSKDRIKVRAFSVLAALLIGALRAAEALVAALQVPCSHGAAQAAFTQFPVQTLAVLTATRTNFC